MVKVIQPYWKFISRSAGWAPWTSMPDRNLKIGDSSSPKFWTIEMGPSMDVPGAKEPPLMVSDP
jgi:hypothetical protein